MVRLGVVVVFDLTRFVVVDLGCVVELDLEGLVLCDGVVLRVFDLVVFVGDVVVLVFGVVACCGVCLVFDPPDCRTVVPLVGP